MDIDSNNYNPEKAPTQDLVARLFGDRLERQRLSVAEIAMLISERQKMLQKNIKTLDYQLCTVGGIKNTFEEIHYAPDLATLLKDKLSLEKTVNELDTKKADEYKQCWKDISTLRMDLLEGLAEYMSIHNKAEMLNPADSKSAALLYGPTTTDFGGDKAMNYGERTRLSGFPTTNCVNDPLGCPPRNYGNNKPVYGFLSTYCRDDNMDSRRQIAGMTSYNPYS